MKKTILAAAAILFTLNTSAQTPWVRPDLGLKPERTVLLYPEGQNSDKGIALGPGDSNGVTDEEFTKPNGDLYNVGDRARFDLYLPQAPNGQMIIICPGGGYAYSATLNEGLYLAKMFLDHGIAAAVLHYRMPHGHYTVPLTDVQNTFRYCRAHAEEWGVRQIGVLGGSAGGHLAASASTLFTDGDTRPDFSILYYPVITMDDAVTNGWTKKNLLGSLKDDPALNEKYSLEKQVTEKTPNTFLILCEDDTAVPMENGIRYYYALRANKVPSEIHIYPHGGHGWGCNKSEYIGPGRDHFEYARPTFEPVLFRWLDEMADFGIKPNTGKDVSAAFKAALNECREKGIKTLRLAPGRYDFWPESATEREIFVSNTSSEVECPSKVKHIGLLIENQDGLTIDGNGAELIFHGKQTMISIIHSKNITLQNLTIDCERPCGSELTVEKVEKGSVTIRFHRDSWYSIDDKGHLDLTGEGWKTEHPHCIEYDPVNGHMTYSGHWDELWKSRATEIEPGLVRFDIRKSSTFTPGHVITIRDRYRDEVGILNLENENITFRHLNIRYLHAIGVVSQFTRDITYDHVNCEPDPRSGRILASSADFFHFSGCAGKITVTGCRFSGAHDDPINVHGTYLRIEDKPAANQVRLRFMHHQTYGMQAFWPGDTVSFVNVASLKTEALTTVAEVNRLSEREVLLTLNDEVPASVIPKEYCVENLTWTPEVEIRGCRFARVSTRGTLMTTPRRVVIADNEYYKTGMCAIYISGDASDWYESGAVKDVTITGNTFIDCGFNGSPGNAVIAIQPTNTIIDPENPVHTGIRIINNKFLSPEKEPVYAKSVGGLIFEDNTILPYLP